MGLLLWGPKSADGSKSVDCGARSFCFVERYNVPKSFLMIYSLSPKHSTSRVATISQTLLSFIPTIVDS